MYHNPQTHPSQGWWVSDEKSTTLIAYMKKHPHQLTLEYPPDGGEHIIRSPEHLPLPARHNTARQTTLDDDTISFFERYGFHDQTIDKLVHASYRTGTRKGRWSHTDGAWKKDRIIDAPNRLLRALQDWMLHEPLAGLDQHISPIAYGILGRQIPDMIEQHCEHRYFLKLDLTHAYDFVDPARLATQLTDLSDIPYAQWHTILKRFACGKSGGLATGSKLSPLLFNIYMAPIDEAFMQLAERDGLTVTRYMDDIVFSSAKPIGKRRAKTVKGMLGEYGFSVNQHKVRYHDQEQGSPFLICGIQINPSGSWHIQRSALRNILRELDDLDTRDGDLDKHEIGVARGLHGYVKTSLQGTHRSPSNPLELRVLRTFRRIEQLYQLKHPSETQRLRAIGRRAI